MVRKIFTDYTKPLSLLQEFKTFAIRGNVLDLAVGIIIGAAFGKIVNSLVSDIITPLLGVLTNSVDLTDKAFTLTSATPTTPAVILNYGVFLNNVLEFLIVGFAIFIIVKQVNRLKRTEPAPEPTTRECPFCFSVIQKKAIRCAACTSEIRPETPALE